MLQTLVKNILDLIFPIECLYCQKEDTWICPECFLSLEFKNHSYCLNCHKNKTLKGFCLNCQDYYFLDKLLIAGSYQEDKLNKALKLLKYRFIKDLAKDLGNFLTLYIYHKQGEAFTSNQDLIIVPIPLYWKRQNWRGFNQSELIAQQIAQNLDLKLNTDLKRIKQKTPQTRLNKKARQENIKTCFKWQGKTKNIQKKDILLIDDIVTTGATLNEAAKELKKSGARQVIGLTVAGE